MAHLKPCIVFLLYHGKSHFNASFQLARSLQNTHEVLFVGVEAFKQHVISQGFHYQILRTVPFGIGLEEWTCFVQQRRPVYWNTVKDRWRDYLYKEREAELNRLIEKVSPAVILLDAQQSTDLIVLHPFVASGRIKLGLIHFNIPSTLTEDTSGKWRRKWFQKIKYFGFDDQFIIKRRIKRNQVPAHYFTNREIHYGCDLTHIHDFILFPREFDFPDASVSQFQNYLGSQIDCDRKENFPDEYLHLKSFIHRAVNTEGKKVIYCSFGTVPLTNKNIVVLFLNKVISVIDRLNAVLLVSTTLDRDELTKPSNRIFVLPEVPQLDVLSYTDVFITHGGSNSVKESIAQCVPMLVCPVESRIDQPGNATRVQFHGLGLQGNIKTDSEAEILGKISNLLTNPSYRVNLAKLKAYDSSHSLTNLFDFLNHE